MTKVTLDGETKNFRPCWKCGGSQFEVHDCGYSSFNVGHAKCRGCGHKVECDPALFNPLETIAKAWNGDKSKARRHLKDVEKEAAKLKKLLQASDKRGER